MESYLRFWRLFPRLTMGIVFFASAIGLILGDAASRDLVDTVRHVDFKAINEFASGLVFILALIGFSSIGLYMLEITTFFLGSVFKLIVMITGSSHVLIKLGLAPFVLSAAELGLHYCRSNRAEVHAFLLNRNLATPETIEKAIEIRKHTEEVMNLLESLQNTELMHYFGFYSTVTQDQRKLLNARDDVSELYFLWLCSLTVTILGIRFGYGAIGYLGAVGIALILLILLYPLLRARLKALAIFTLYLYFDNFTVWDMNIEDRDAG